MRKGTDEGECFIHFLKVMCYCMCNFFFYFSTVTVNLNTYLYYTSIYSVCTVVMLCSVMQRLRAQDKCLYRTIKYILSHFIRLLRVMVMFSLSQASWAQQICEDIRLVISCCVLMCQELPDQRGHHVWCQRHVLPWCLPLVSQTGRRGFLLICLISVYLYLCSFFRQHSHHFTDIL